jgi:hypothetical protein
MELDEADNGGATAEDCGDELGPVDGAAAAPATAKQQTLEQIDPGFLHASAVKALTGLAPLVEGVDPDHIGPGFKEPVRGSERARFALPLYEMWTELAAERWMLEPVSKVFKLLLALPAGEAHCERVIGALRKMVSPFGFSMCEKTILARLAAHGRA